MVKPGLHVAHMAAPCLVQAAPVLGEPFWQLHTLAETHTHTHTHTYTHRCTRVYECEGHALAETHMQMHVCVCVCVCVVCVCVLCVCVCVVCVCVCVCVCLFWLELTIVELLIRACLVERSHSHIISKLMKEIAR